MTKTCAGCAQSFPSLYVVGRPDEHQALADELQDLCADCAVALLWRWESTRLGIPVEDMARRVAAAQDRRDFIKLMHRARPANEDES